MFSIYILDLFRGTKKNEKERKRSERKERKRSRI